MSKTPEDMLPPYARGAVSTPAAAAARADLPPYVGSAFAAAVRPTAMANLNTRFEDATDSTPFDATGKEQFEKKLFSEEAQKFMDGEGQDCSIPRLMWYMKIKHGSACMAEINRMTQMPAVGNTITPREVLDFTRKQQAERNAGPTPAAASTHATPY